jgi:hypothetical protein
LYGYKISSFTLKDNKEFIKNKVFEERIRREIICAAKSSGDRRLQEIS